MRFEWTVLNMDTGLTYSFFFKKTLTNPSNKFCTICLICYKSAREWTPPPFFFLFFFRIIFPGSNKLFVVMNTPVQTFFKFLIFLFFCLQKFHYFIFLFYMFFNTIFIHYFLHCKVLRQARLIFWKTKHDLIFFVQLWFERSQHSNNIVLANR